VQLLKEMEMEDFKIDYGGSDHQDMNLVDYVLVLAYYWILLPND
jgi:hypothetical protein